MMLKKYGGWVSGVLVVALGLGACGRTENDDAVKPAGDDEVSPNASGGSKGSVLSSGGESPQGSGGGGSLLNEDLIEPDEGEGCTIDPRADEWVSGVMPGDYEGEELKVGGNLLLARGQKSEGSELYVGHVGETAVSFEPLLEFGDETELQAWEVAPDGRSAMVIYGAGAERRLRIYTTDVPVPGWQTPLPVPEALQEGRIGLLLLSQGRAIITSRAGTGLRVDEFDGSRFAEGGVAEFFGRLQRGADETLVSYRSPSLTDDPHKRIEYVWGEGFGDPEDLPEVIERGFSWTEWHREFASGIGLRVVTPSSDDANKEGMYLHTRRNGLWDTGLYFSSATDTASASSSDWFGYAGSDLLYFQDTVSAITVRTSSDSSWTDALPLPRSRSTTYLGNAGDANGTTLVVAEQTIPDEEVHSLKLYRRGNDGTWYCPVLVPPQLSHWVYGDNGGSYVAATGGYQLPLTIWALARKQ